MKKLLSVLFSTLQRGLRGGLLFLALVASVSATYASDTQVDGIWYDFDSSTKTASVTYRGRVYSSYDAEYYGSVVIPETVTYSGTTYSVTSIGNYAFYDCPSLTSVTIPNSVTSIGHCAFYDCSKLTSVTIPNSVTSIGDWAFSGCSALTSPIYTANCFAYMPTSYAGFYEIPEGIRQIAGCAFYNCSSLTSVTIPNSVTSIGGDAFYGCSSLTSITIPNSVTSIGNSAFYGCSSLTSITIPNNIISIGEKAFCNCSSLTVVQWNIKNYPSSLTKTFLNCPVTMFVFGNNVEYIPSNICSDMNKLQSITIPNNIVSIGWGAFENCSSLTSVTIPNSVTSIGNGAFDGCYFTTENCINNSSCTSNYEDFFGATIVDSDTDGILVKDSMVIACRGNVISASIPKGVKSIEINAFSEHPNLTSISIGNDVKIIKAGAFKACETLTSVSITDSVISIDHSAFEDCYALTDFNISSNIQFIESSALDDTPWYKNLPDGLVYVGDVLYAYKGTMPANTSIDIKEGTVSISPAAFYNCSTLVSVTFPNSLLSIGSGSFTNCTSLTSIVVPENAISIGELAFSGCTALNTIIWNSRGTYTKKIYTNSVLPPSIADGMFVGNEKKTAIFDGSGAVIDSFIFGENVEHIPGKLCYKMTNLKNINLPVRLKTIGDAAFYGCTSLTSITIPDSVIYVGHSAFEDAPLTSIVWNAKKCEDFFWKTGAGDGGRPSQHPFMGSTKTTSITFGEGVEHIPGQICKRMTGLTSITIPNSVTSIGGSAFIECSALYSINLGNSVTSIGNYAFSDCSSLTSITIPNSVTIIGDYAFRECSALSSINLGNSVMSIGNNAFSNCSSLTSVTIPNSVTSIGSYAFSNCPALTSVTINNSATSIESGAFRECSALSSINLGNSVTSIGDKAFFDCSRLNNVVLGNSVMTIGERAFCNCSIRSLTIPNSVTSIGDGAFGNNSFTSVTVPSSVTSVGYSIFGGCNRLSSIVWNANTGDSYYDYDGTPISPIGTLNALKSIVFGDSVEYIPAEMCHNSNSIESVTIGKNVKRIGKLAFNNCTGLTQVNYTGDVLGWCQMNFTYINDNPNYYAKNLYINGEKVIDLVIPKSVKTINPYTFYGCSELSSLVIPKSVTSIGTDAFGECRKLYDIYCYPTTPPTAEESSFANYNVNLYVPCESLKDYQMDMVFGSFKYIQCLEDLIPSEPQDTTITHTAEMVTICEGEAYKWHGYEYSQSGTYTYTETEETEEYIYHNVYTLELTVLPSETIEYVIEAEDSYEWHGVVYTESGTYTYRYECTTEILYLTIKDTPDTPDNPIIDTVITGLQYADAYFIADAEYGDYWVFDLYQDYDAYDYVYPEVYVMVNEAYSKNSLNGTYNVFYTEYYTDAESMISTDDEAEDFVGTLTIKHVEGTNYSFNGSFVVDGTTYTYDQIVNVFAWEYSAEEETYYELTLSEIDSPDTPDTPDRVLSCAEAVTICLETGTTATTEEYTIRGYVTDIKTEYSEQYNNISFYMADTQDGGHVLYTYRVKPKFEADVAVKVGDFVEVVGTLVNYNGLLPEVYPGIYTIVNEPGSPTGTSDILSPTSNTQKLVKDGQLLIIHDGKTYTVMGAEVK